MSKGDGKYLLKWVGGKRLLRKKIASLVPDDIKLYAEPFGGAGRFLLSYGDSDEVRELYEGFYLLEVTRTKGINNINPNGREYEELLIANYDISKQGKREKRQALLWEIR